jgi:hypothetical protein
VVKRITAGINVGFGGTCGNVPCPAKTYMFDTGSPPFNAPYSAQWWPSNPTPVATMPSYCYSSTVCFSGNVVSVPSISFYTSTNTLAYTLPTPTSGGYQITAVTGMFNSNTGQPNPIFSNIQNNQPRHAGANPVIISSQNHWPMVAEVGLNPGSISPTCLGPCYRATLLQER